MIHWLSEADKAVFLFLNGIHNNFLDILMTWITNKYTWFPLYGLLIVWLAFRFRLKGLGILIFTIIVVALCDQVTSSFMKPFFERLRPCHAPDIRNLTHLVTSCGGLYGFASSHAANSFGMAVFLFLVFKKTYRWFVYFLIWAALVSYSRIYVGVHYPGDVMTGALVGCLFAFLAYIFYRKLPGPFRLYGEDR